MSRRRKESLTCCQQLRSRTVESRSCDQANQVENSSRCSKLDRVRRCSRGSSCKTDLQRENKQNTTICSHPEATSIIICREFVGSSVCRIESECACDCASIWMPIKLDASAERELDKHLFASSNLVERHTSVIEIEYDCNNSTSSETLNRVCSKRLCQSICDHFWPRLR